MEYKHQIDIKENKAGDSVINLPPILLRKLGWKEGDNLKFESAGDGSMQIKKVNLESVEVDFNDEELFKYMKFAHEAGMSFDELCAEALRSPCTEDLPDSNNPHLADHPFDPLDHEQTK